MRRIVVLIIDGQPIFRAGVRRALSHQDGLERLEILDCDPGKEGQEAIRQIAENSPDVALLDIGSPSLSGLELCRYITRHFPATKVVVLSANTNADELFETIKSGAVAYLSKDSIAEELLETIRRASLGEYLINETFGQRPGVASRVLEELQDAGSTGETGEALSPPLTTKEVHFLNLMAEDNSKKQIAAILGISEQVIDNYVSSILRKLSASDRAHAVMLALCSNWLSIQENGDGPQSAEQLCAEPLHIEYPGLPNDPTKSTPKPKRRTSRKPSRATVAPREAQDRA